MDFYPRPPRGGRRRIYMLRSLLVGFLSTPSARRATHTTTKQEDKNHISIHALREEGDDGIFFISLFKNGFLSTPSARRATVMIPRAADAPTNFYPRPPRGGRLACVTTLLNCGDFYPRPPRGGRHIFRQSLAYLIPISIHALREEGDPTGQHGCFPVLLFLSTPSARRATNGSGSIDVGGIFLSTPSARRATIAATARETIHGDFYPRPPRGGRRRSAACTGRPG